MRIENLQGAPGFILAEGSRTRLIDVDWDYPSVASAFGWDIRSVQISTHFLVTTGAACRHDGTDGTVVCPDCGVTPSTFIESARKFLDKASDNGTEVEDPGYFSQEENS